MRNVVIDASARAPWISSPTYGVAAAAALAFFLRLAVSEGLGLWGKQNNRKKKESCVEKQIGRKRVPFVPVL